MHPTMLHYRTASPIRDSSGYFPAGIGKSIPTNNEQPETSRSLWDQTIAPQNLVAGDNNSQWGYADGPDRQRLRVLVRHIALPRTAEGIEEAGGFRFTVASSVDETEADVLRFN